VFQKNKLENITTSKACGEMQNYTIKQILKNRMAKENNPNPNKFKVSPWLVYTAILLIFLFISFVTGSSSLQRASIINFI
jgi:hypothetical protein